MTFQTYRCLPNKVEAYQLTEDMLCADTLPPGIKRSAFMDDLFYVVPTQGRPVPIKPGEWVVSEGDGVHHYPVADVVFRKRYELETTP